VIKAYKKQQMKIRDQITQLTRPKTPRKKESGPKKGTSRMRDAMSGEAVEQMSAQAIVDRLYDILTVSQASVVVDSTTAKLLVIRKEDKGFLSEELKFAIDQAVLAENFQDFDRPEKTPAEVQTAVDRTRGWDKWKAKLIDEFLTEANMNRRTNKLVDN